jgi:hypothetical protein
MTLTTTIEADEQILNPEYDKVLDGLEQVDLNSPEGQEIADVLGTLQVKCE